MTHIMRHREEPWRWEPAGQGAGGPKYKTPITVVLTTAHMDHRPENCLPLNLLAMCQRCHLRYDRKHHAKSARDRKRAAKNKNNKQGGLF